MAYTSRITYPIYDLNASAFLTILQEILQVEMLNQRTAYTKSFLPKLVKTDEYLLNPVSNTDLDPSFCSIVKTKADVTDNRFTTQQANINNYAILVYANGISNLRKILDAIYIILNDTDIKAYLFRLKNSNNENLIWDSGSYFVKSLDTDYDINKSMNDKDVVLGAINLEVAISEVAKLNTYPELTSIEVINKVGNDEIGIKQLINL